ncbi:MAG: bifunctional diaminohydroxyphosphoribosylaminopyrimidine deaminase/5-amino-6-(5-phosphoribosylamino)uracil reductase RibD [Chitinophagaceae bacterium]|nr:MAG: bifunctional diaminohydroxyphosphoribosylaminopyrimidine deaminase/5-amino-6-(5-phosphoribosylamino)uracil reductase RibD [Chitinophagaceae bacterium]
MQRCNQLAQLGRGSVAPNPMVGSVLVYQDRIIGEGYHKQYGQAHAEVNCIASVKKEDKHLIDQSTLYVSLEPCAHFGKTPPCADLIIDKKIPHVLIGCRDPFEQVNGKGIEKLKAAGIKVEQGVLEAECKSFNKRFFTFHKERRPYIILKWAQTLDNRMASFGRERLKISNEATNRLVHKWRSEEAAILVGTNTALADDPQLGARLWPGKNPVRVVLDMNLRLPDTLQVFDGKIPTVIFNKYQHTLPFGQTPVGLLEGVNYYQVTEDVSFVHQLLNGLYQLGVQSILVEGGAQLLQSFIDDDTWDEARVITNETLVIGNGLPAPDLGLANLVKSEQIFSDSIRTYKRTES